MRLLVSVRSAEEVSAALAGGADIIDAKEPARGSLGRVTPAVLSAIAARTPASVPFSVALGDCADLDTLRAALDGVRLGERLAQVYLKLGFAGVRSLERSRIARDRSCQRQWAGDRRGGLRGLRCSPEPLRRKRAARRDRRPRGRFPGGYLAEGRAHPARPSLDRGLNRAVAASPRRRPALRRGWESRSRWRSPAWAWSPMYSVSAARPAAAVGPARWMPVEWPRDAEPTESGAGAQSRGVSTRSPYASGGRLAERDALPSPMPFQTLQVLVAASARPRGSGA